MHHLSRRSMFRLAGGAAGATGLAGGLLVPAHAAGPKVKVWLKSTVVRPGETLTLRLVENLGQDRKIRVRDSNGLVWTRRSKSRRSKVWTATMGMPGSGTVTVTVKRQDGKVFRRELGYRVADTITPDEQRPPQVGTGPLIRMSAPSEVWDQRVAQVGAGLAARRIFADLAAGPDSQLRQVEEAHAAGMLPVVSYKVGGDLAGAISGAWNATANQAAARLASFGLPTAVTFWHEPNGDMTGAQYAAASRQVLPAFKRGELKVGPILNGWLLDNQVPEFTSYCPDDLFALWDYVGIDTYEGGTAASPGARKPADRITALSAYVRSRGYDLPLGVGEYSGFSAETIRAAGEALMTTPNVWFGCIWNAKAERNWELSGDRLAAFRETLADARSIGPRVVAR